MRNLNSLIVLILFFCSCAESTVDSPETIGKKALILKGEKSFLRGYEPLNENGTINVVVEIPAGTLDKWEVDKQEEDLRWEFKNGKPRVVQYLGYPGNYGMIPKTLLPKQVGGDGDPLDVIVLGPSVKRGTILEAKVIGVLKLLDKGEQDDKLIAVAKGSPMYTVNSMSELDNKFIGVSLIIKTWFESYKGPGKLIAKGFAEKEEALEILQMAIKSF